MKCEINPGNTLETCQSILGINPSHSQIYSWYWHKLSLSVPDLHKNSKKTKHVTILWNKIPSLKLGWEFVLGDFAVCLFPPPKKKNHLFGQSISAASHTVVSTLWPKIYLQSWNTVAKLFSLDIERYEEKYYENMHIILIRNHIFLQSNTEKILILVSNPGDNQLLSLKRKVVGPQTPSGKTTSTFIWL